MQFPIADLTGLQPKRVVSTGLEFISRVGTRGHDVSYTYADGLRGLAQRSGINSAGPQHWTDLANPHFKTDAPVYNLNGLNETVPDGSNLLYRHINPGPVDEERLFVSTPQLQQLIAGGADEATILTAAKSAAAKVAGFFEHLRGGAPVAYSDPVVGKDGLSRISVGTGMFAEAAKGGSPEATNAFLKAQIAKGPRVDVSLP